MAAKRKQAGSTKIRSSRVNRQEPNLAEHRLWQRLRGRQLTGMKFRRQHAVGQFIADFVCVEAGLIVEVDGSQHADRRNADERRTRALEAQGYQVIRFWASDVLQRTDDVLREIIKFAKAASVKR